MLFKEVNDAYALQEFQSLHSSTATVYVTEVLDAQIPHHQFTDHLDGLGLSNK